MWKVEKIINFKKNEYYIDGYAFVFFGEDGTKLYFNYANNWAGLLLDDGQFLWTIGEKQNVKSQYHFDIEIKNPHYITKQPDNSVLLSEQNGIHKIDYNLKKIETLIECKKTGIESAGNCIVDSRGDIWINDVIGYKVFRFDKEGNLIEILGNGKPGFSKEDTPFEKVQFNWIYDIRKGTDGNIYVLDSKNYVIRMIDVKKRIVKLVAGTGEAGYSGDNNNPLNATFGGNSEEHFDGPWSLSLDEFDNIYVGDTQNHVLRMIDRKANIIKTIAGNPNAIQGKRNNPDEKDPFKINLPRICSLEYYNKRVYIPEWDGDLIVLRKK
jgi:hypothetical protein